MRAETWRAVAIAEALVIVAAGIGAGVFLGRSGRRTMLVATAALLGGLVGGADAEDILAARACVEFNRVVADVKAGVISEADYNRRMQKVFDDGRLAEDARARKIFYDFQRTRLGSGSREEYMRATAYMMALCHTPE